MGISRREFIRNTALASAVAAAGLSSTACASKSQSTGEIAAQDKSLQWKTAVCRYCGIGCGMMLGIKDGKLAAVVGDSLNESSQGLNCVKGFHLAKVLYSEERLLKPMVRDDASTKGSLEGLREATWEEALDLAASKLKETWKKDKSRLAFWGSGQQTVTEGYIMSKFWKAGLRSNNIDPNARLCMASAVVALMDQFQTDEPAGCYADIDEADVFVTWGANMAEAHPVLFSRILRRLDSSADARHIDLGTQRTRTSARATYMEFKPQTDIAIANCIARYIVHEEKYNKDFIEHHVQFKAGTENLGHAYKDDYDATDAKEASKNWSITFEEYKNRLEPYTFEYVSGLSGVPVDQLRDLAELYADPNKKVLSLWTMGVNQHSRGTWMNNCIYNMHLLTGKFGQPGNAAFSLTGQPSACGTAREVGLFAHRLPADLVVANEQHRRYSEAIWNLPTGWLDEISKPGFHTVKIFRELSKGNIDFLWTSTVNFAQSMPDLTRILGKEAPYEQGIKHAFIAVNDAFLTESCKYADVVFPAAFWVEREGQFGNAERRTSIFEKCLEPRGESLADMRIYLEIARRVLGDEPAAQLSAEESASAAASPFAQEQPESLFDQLFGFVWDKKANAPLSDDRQLCTKLFEEYRCFSNPEMNKRAQAIHDDVSGSFGAKLKLEAKRLAPYEVYLQKHGLSWPVQELDGDWHETRWRFAAGSQKEGFDQVNIEHYGKDALHEGLSLYKTAGYKASVIFRPYEAPAESPDDQYPFWFATGRLLEHWHTGSMTRTVPELNRALKEAYLYLNPEDADSLGIKSGDKCKISSRHGNCEITACIDERIVPQRGSSFAPFFDPAALINLVVHDYYCPLSKEPDFKKTCIKIEKVSA